MNPLLDEDDDHLMSDGQVHPNSLGDEESGRRFIERPAVVVERPADHDAKGGGLFPNPQLLRGALIGYGQGGCGTRR